MTTSFGPIGFISSRGEFAQPASWFLVAAYVFAGQSYEGTRVWILGLTKQVANRYRLHKALWDAHNAGSTVPVFVNPTNPSKAILDRRWPWLSMLVTGIVVAGIFDVVNHFKIL